MICQKCGRQRLRNARCYHCGNTQPYDDLIFSEDYEMEDKPKQPNEPVKSTTEDVQIYHADDDDVLIVRIDAKHPARQKIFAGIQAALEGAQRNEEAIKAKAYAAEKLPDDWRRAKSEKPEERTIRHAEPHHYPAKTEK